MMQFQDLGNVRRFVRLQQAALFSGGAARLTELKRSLSSFRQGEKLICIECQPHLAMASRELNEGDPIGLWRRKMDVFNKWKVAVIDQMVIDRAVPDAIAEVEGITWRQDESAAADTQTDPICVHIDTYVGGLDDCHGISLSDGVPNSPPSDAKAGGASSSTREGGAA